ncbi:ATP-binding protein [Halosimplex salinum]|uniref:ATP-binding protein n=1 Tax=Halosimplex salinum TaxID=1710538 RepID=UPI000F4914BD|nr:ATP-binding protein [Halosimplex salinum]
MKRHRRWDAGSVAVASVGSVLALTAVVHHSAEAAALGSLRAPALALLLDGTPAVALAYGGYRLRETELDSAYKWVVAVWCLGGVVAFTGAVGLTILVRLFEERVVSEPQFTLLVTASFGGLAGTVAGYYRARAVADANRARRASDTLAFVNGLIRHDLRNDIQVIHAYAGEIESADTDTDDEVSEHAEIVREKADEAYDRIDATGSLARTVAGDADYEPVDLAAVVADVADTLESATRATVTTDLPDRAPVVANAGLRSVVDNLAENAVEHNDSDEPRVSLAVERSEEHTRLTVDDDGPGIPADERPSAFSRGEGTSGGGLQIASTLVERYDGDLRIEGNDPGGTTVVVELPTAADEEASAATEARPVGE